MPRRRHLPSHANVRSTTQPLPGGGLPANHEPEKHKPGIQYQCDEELAGHVSEISTTIFHPVGTAGKGHEGDPNAVLDPRLRVKGVAGLRVIDASIMLDITSGNTNASTLMIAERTTAWIHADSGKGR